MHEIQAPDTLSCTRNVITAHTSITGTAAHMMPSHTLRGLTTIRSSPCFLASLPSWTDCDDLPRQGASEHDEKVWGSSRACRRSHLKIIRPSYAPKTSNPQNKSSSASAVSDEVIPRPHVDVLVIDGLVWLRWSAITVACHGRGGHRGGMSRQQRARESADRLISSAALVLLTASCWCGWMAWDHTYQTDPGTGITSGPYQPWQVIGCIVCLFVLGVGATVRLPVWLVVPIMSVTFTAAWSATAVANSDGAGLWVVGAMLVFVGMLAGTVIVSGLTAVVRTREKPGTTISTE